MSAEGALRFVDQESRWPLSEVVVTLVMDNGGVGPKFTSDDRGFVQIPEETLRDHDGLLADKAGYFLLIQETRDVEGVLALQRNRPVRGQLVNVPQGLEQRYSLQLWLRYPQKSLPDPTWSRHFENSDRNATIRANGLQGPTILIDPAFPADGEVWLEAISRNSGGSETLVREPLPIGREWIELDLRNVTPAVQDSSLTAQIMFDAPGPTGDFYAELRDSSGNAFTVGGGDALSRSEGQRSVSGVWRGLKPETYIPVVTFINQVTYYLDPVEIDGNETATLRVGSEGTVEAIVGVGDHTQEDLGRVRVLVYDAEGRRAMRMLVPFPEANSTFLKYLSPGEYTLYAEAEVAGLVSKSQKAEVRSGSRSQVYLEMRTGHVGRIVLEGSETAAQEGVLTVLSSDGTLVRRNRYSRSDLVKGRVANYLLPAATYEAVIEVEVDGEKVRATRELDLREGDTRVSFSFRQSDR